MSTLEDTMLVPLSGGRSVLLDSGFVLVSSCLLKVGRGRVRRISITTTDHLGWVLLFDATSLPEIGSRSPLAEFDVGMWEGQDFKLAPPAPFERGALLVFSLTPFPNLKPSATAVLDGDVS